jgi:hypothetical protein
MAFGVVDEKGDILTVFVLAVFWRREVGDDAAFDVLSKHQLVVVMGVSLAYKHRAPLRLYDMGMHLCFSTRKAQH